MKHLLNFTDLTEDYSLYLESEDFELNNDFNKNDEEETSFDDLDWGDEDPLTGDDIMFKTPGLRIEDEDDLGTEEENEEYYEGKESGVTASLKKKSKASGIPVGILRKVFSKGMQAWNAGHRPGVAQHQWGMGRVNSFITGAGGARKADAALWAQAKKAKARKKKKK